MIISHCAVMVDPGLRSYLYTEAERSMQELVSKGAISPGGHAEIMKILASEQGGGQQIGYPGPYPGQPVGYQSYPGQAYPVQQAYSVQQPYPVQQVETKFLIAFYPTVSAAWLAFWSSQSLVAKNEGQLGSLMLDILGWNKWILGRRTCCQTH